MIRWFFSEPSTVESRLVLINAQGPGIPALRPDQGSSTLADISVPKRAFQNGILWQTRETDRIDARLFLRQYRP